MPVDTETIVNMTLRERSSLLAYILVIYNDEHAAEDIFQDVTMIAIKKQKEIESVEHLMGWLRTTARFRALQTRRNQGKHEKVLDPDVLAALEVTWQKYDQTNSTSETLIALRQCIDQLTPQARNVLELRYVSGLSGQRLADRLGRSLSTAYVAVSRLHYTLQSCIRSHLAGRSNDRA